MAHTASVRLSDYRAFPFFLDEVCLHFVLDEKQTHVKATLDFRAKESEIEHDLVLNGKKLDLKSISLNGQSLTQNDYTQTGDSLVIDAATLGNASSFMLSMHVCIHPKSNLALEGLYVSKSMLCTQCEAEGFRRIMYFPDRPDVMARYKVTIEGDSNTYPVMISNGNVVAQSCTDGIRKVIWHDPHPKPCYLFALVAGQLARVEDSFTTVSARTVALHMYVEKHNVDKCDHALQSLKKAMRWDEQVYAREYDLDLFQIVATDDFNSGAMENKGLNIFNSECVLAHPRTATDSDYLTIDSIVAHEYFHNWSGNRVTLRDWFQLSLKEGFTVFRENQYISDMHSSATRRVEDASLLQTSQFAEDASPTRHPVRPDNYQQIRNFYTLTVYEKGAEVVRMIQTIIGKQAFSQGALLYFSRHDGQAVCVEDFVHAMEDASGKNLHQCMYWYTQAGTPEVSVTLTYDAKNTCCDIQCTQNIPTDEQAKPLVIPIEIALFDAKGKALCAPFLRILSTKEQTFRIDNICEKPVPSLLRGFSAPVRLHYQYTDADLRMLIANESDGYSRWSAAQRYKTKALLQAIELYPANNSECTDILRALFSSLQTTALACSHTNTDEQALASMLLSLPSYSYLCEQQKTIQVDPTWHTRLQVLTSLGKQLADGWQALAQRYESKQEYQVSFEAITQRSLYIQAMFYLAQGKDNLHDSYRKRYQKATNLTERLAALEILVWHKDTSYRQWALQHFLDSAQGDPALINRWFECQASIPERSTRELVVQLTEHPLFDWHNPNKLRSLFGVFAYRNPVAFHCEEGYAFYADTLLHIDSYNPQIAAGLATPLFRWKRYAQLQSKNMLAQLERISVQNISEDLREGVSKSLPA